MPVPIMFDQMNAALFTAANLRNDAELVVTAAEIHRHLGQYSGHNHRFAAMRRAKYARDWVVTSPPNRFGAGLTVAYRVRH